MKIGKKEFDFDNQIYIMGILNATPDSFSDGGLFFTDGKVNVDNAVKTVEKMISDGAGIVDIGGESTRPGYTEISEEEEMERICPVIEKISKNLEIAVSVDTYKSKVAEESLRSGAHMINDIWGLKADSDMAYVAKKYDVPVCIMHNRDVEKYPYSSFLEDVIKDIEESLAIADTVGIGREKIILDPGVGFGKNYQQNLEIMANMDKLKLFNVPILLGASRKSVIGLTLDLPVDEREEGTMATTTVGVMKGCSIIRVHDVKANYRAAKMALAIRKREEL